MTGVAGSGDVIESFAHGWSLVSARGVIRMFSFLVLLQTSDFRLLQRAGARSAGTGGGEVGMGSRPVAMA